METVITAPALMLLIGLVWVCGMIVYTRGVVSNADQDAARIASISRTAPAAQANALTQAQEDLSNSHLHCAQMHVHVDTTDFSTPVGTPALVTVTVYCRIALSDLLIPGLPGSHIEQFSFTSVVDRYREH